MKKFVFWFLTCFLITLFCGLAYASAQQVLRQEANDPQIQIAEDTASVLNTGKNPVDIIPKDSVHVNSSLSPFVMVFDNNGKLLASNADIKNAASTPPQEVFDADYITKDLVTLKKQLAGESSPGEKIFTWQPAPGLRLASVLVKYNDGFVLSGRSLRLTEGRTQQMFGMAFLVWVLGIGATSVAFFLSSRLKK